jgi:hypothetical protein
MTNGMRCWLRFSQGPPERDHRLGSFGMNASLGGWVRLGATKDGRLGSSGRETASGRWVRFGVSEDGRLGSFWKSDSFGLWGRRRPSEEDRLGSFGSDLGSQIPDPPTLSLGSFFPEPPRMLGSFCCKPDPNVSSVISVWSFVGSDDDPGPWVRFFDADSRPTPPSPALPGTQRCVGRRVPDRSS